MRPFFRVLPSVVCVATFLIIAGDPLLPAIDLVNLLRHSAGVRAGQVITTGTCTGLHFGQPGDRIEVEFTGFGRARILLAAG